MRTRIFFRCVILLFFVSTFASGAYAASFRGPWEEDCAQRTSAKQTRRGFNPMRALVKIYRNYISPIDGKECPMYPSCSEYSLLCMKKHGLLIGWVMTCDRLLHEADEIRKAPVIYVNGQEMLYDPVENNDFWWHSER